MSEGTDIFISINIMTHTHRQIYSRYTRSNHYEII